MAAPAPDFRISEVASPECRDLGHAWSWGAGDIIISQQDPGLIDRKLTCLRCRSTRSEVVARRTGNLEQRRYAYVPGYRITGQGRLNKETFRVESLRRILGAQGGRRR